MSVFRKINGSMIPVTTEGHPQYYFKTQAQAEAALSQLEEGADVFVEEGSNEDLLPRVEQAEEDIAQLNSDLTPVDGILTFDGNWGGSDFQLRKIGKQVTFYIKYQTGKNTNFTADLVAILPTGFRPSVGIYLPTVKFDSSGLTPTGHGYLFINPNGNVSYYGNPFAFQEYIFANGSFVVN